MNIDKKNSTISYDRYILLISIGTILIIAAFVYDSPDKIFNGIIRIIEEPDFLISDYFGIGGIGAGLLNSGLLMVQSALLLLFIKTDITGAGLAAEFTVCGFALFGKNILNVWFILLGVFIYSKYHKERFKKYVYIALFGTTLSPVVTEIMFGLGFVNPGTILLGAFAGMFIGFFLPPLSSFLLRVHQGFNLYNIGFAGGVAGTILVSLFRSYGYPIEARIIWTKGNNFKLSVLLYFIFVLMIIFSFILDNEVFYKLKKIYKYKGRLITDFVLLEGFPVTILNMAVNGIIASLYVLITGGDLNGPSIGGILTITGFGAFGKHGRNMTPVMLGVFLSGLIGQSFGGLSLTSPQVQLAALFSTTLAPISGEFGPFIGIIAGMLHESVALNIAYLHGGFNLYNNGFAGGLVAAFLVPVVESFRRRENL
ncbi:MAG: DUF1576 domain-containing protein [Bacillota bacterium]|nr:DUF1576 domain-containing protein [Bacillota bacterium]